MTQENDTSTGFSDKQIGIIISTERLFAEKGYEGTSVRDIAQDAGVNVAMISYYFGSKEKLLEAIYAYRISLSKVQLETLLQDKELTPTQKIERLIDNYVEKILRNPHFHRINLHSKQALEMKAIAGMIYQNKLQNLELIKKIVQDGQRKKEFVKGVDISMLMVTLLGTTQFMIGNLPFYQLLNKIEDYQEEEVHNHLKKKLTHHLKQVFKSLLTHEVK